MRRDITLPAPSLRFAILHYHLFKNGGSTIESILEREFPGGFATLHGQCADSIVSAEEMSSFLTANPAVRAISSHHFRYPKPDLQGWVVFDWCFIRHPLERIKSMYTYYSNIESPDALGGLARRNDARQFVRTLIDQHPNMVSNVQVTFLGHAGLFTRPARERDLDRAVDAVRDMSIPGQVEMFDESLLAAEHFLRPAFPKIRLEYVAQNVSGGTRHPEAPQDGWNRLWGDDLTRELLQLNELDVQLCLATEHEVRKRCNLVPELSRRLADFRQRCRTLRQHCTPIVTMTEPIAAER